MRMPSSRAPRSGRLSRALVLLAGAALAAPVSAQFDLLAWHLVENPTYPQTTIEVTGDILSVSGPFYPDPCFAPGADGYAEAVAPFDATIVARLLFVPDDRLDWPMYVVNGATHLLPADCQDCEIVFHVQAGDTFGFGNHSADCLFSPAVSIWTGLRVEPEPHAVTVSGQTTSAALGAAVASVGDLDFDGIADVAVGAPHSAVNGPDSGRLVVLSGADGSTLFALDGPQAGLMFGASVASPGDVTGDGVPDLLVGAPLASVSSSLAGRVYLLSGAGGAILSVRDGPNPAAHLGQAVAGPGDVDGDGTPDLFTGAPGAGNFGPGAGAAVVLSGASGGLLLLTGGPDPGDQGGFAIAGAGDRDADGVPDLLVGSPLASPQGLDDAGLVRVISGAGGATLLALEGAAEGGQLGSSLASLGDVDADGVPDLLAGAPYANTPYEHAGFMAFYSGATGAVLHSLQGSGSGDALGWSVAAAGDVDADGVPDALVGAIGSSGSDPGAAGSARVLSGRDGSLLALFGGGATGDQIGAAVAGVGDLDGDGLPDVLVGAPGVDVPPQDAGQLTFYTGIHITWADLGGGIAGTTGTPSLQGEGLLVAGGPLSLGVHGALPAAPLTMVLGLGQLGAPFKGGVLWPQPDVFLAQLVGADGSVELSAVWPASLPAGFTFYAQGWLPDDGAAHALAATNGLRASAP